jgi:hypothetical protein
MGSCLLSWRSYREYMQACEDVLTNGRRNNPTFQSHSSCIYFPFLDIQRSSLPDKIRPTDLISVPINGGRMSSLITLK